MTASRRIIVAIMCAAALTLVVGAATVEAQRGVRRAPVTQGRHAVARPPGPARAPYAGRVYYPQPYYRPYYARPYYRGGFYGGFYAFPFHFSIGFGSAYGPYYGYPYPYAPYPYAYPYRPYAPYTYGYSGYSYDSLSSVRLDVTPRVAEVYVDGYYAGSVDDFDSASRQLRIDPGDHTVDVFLPGHRTLTHRLHLQPGKTFTVRAGLEPLGPGEPEPVRPSGRPAPEPPSRGQDRLPASRVEITRRSGEALP